MAHPMDRPVGAIVCLVVCPRSPKSHENGLRGHTPILTGIALFNDNGGIMRFSIQNRMPP